jgi:hypothetical protein
MHISGFGALRTAAEKPMYNTLYDLGFTMRGDMYRFKVRTCGKRNVINCNLMQSNTFRWL